MGWFRKSDCIDFYKIHERLNSSSLLTLLWLAHSNITFKTPTDISTIVGYITENIIAKRIIDGYVTQEEVDFLRNDLLFNPTYIWNTQKNETITNEI